MVSKAQIVTRVMAFAIGLLSIAAGIPKILQMPQELEFLNSVGLSGIAVSILGVAQLAGGIMLFWSRSRLIGAVLAGLALLVSSVAIFSSGNSGFGLISLLPFAISVLVVYFELKRARGNAD